VAQLRQTVGSDDECGELEGAPLLENVVEQAAVVVADAASQHQVLRPLDGPRRVDLDAAEVARDRDDGISGWVQGRRPKESGRDRNSPRVRDANDAGAARLHRKP
jgi:hypothetical protein